MTLDFLHTDYTIPAEFLWLFFALSVIIFARYIIMSGAYQKLIYDRIAKIIPNRIISDRYPRDQQIKEITWAGISSVLFGITGVLMIMAWQAGWTKIYVGWSDYPIWYVPISFLGALFIHETYYYWLHRWMHLSPKIYRAVHKVHHDSVSTSVWTSFSFHPIESLLQAIIIPAIVFIIPMHWVVLIVLLIWMTISTMINHAGVEIYPSAWRKNKLMKWFIGSTHHDIHHRRFTKNFGLYFTFWDVWMGTESEEFDERWERATK